MNIPDAISIQHTRGARTCLIILAGVALAFGIADAFLFSQGDVPSDRAFQLWSFIYCWTAVLWVDLDSRGRDNIKRSFDFAFLVFIFLPFYLPYYLIRTRRSWGVLGIVGFGTLYVLGSVLSMVVYLSG